MKIVMGMAPGGSPAAMASRPRNLPDSYTALRRSGGPITGIIPIGAIARLFENILAASSGSSDLPPRWARAARRWLRPHPHPWGARAPQAQNHHQDYGNGEDLRNIFDVYGARPQGYHAIKEEG
ncbi:MAG: hypothetical protein QXL31_06015 [Thermosphaera sp.]